MNEPENEGITLIWKIEKSRDKMYHGLLCFNWREDQEKMWRLLIDLNEHRSLLIIQKDNHSSAQLSGRLSLLDINGSEWNLGNFKDLNFIVGSPITHRIYLKNLIDFPLLNDNSMHFIHVRVHLWDELELYKPEPPMQYNISTSLVEQSCNFNWTVKSHMCDDLSGREHFRYQSMQVPKVFIEFEDMKIFNVIISFFGEEFWHGKRKGQFEIKSTKLHSLLSFSCRIRIKDNEGKYMQLSELKRTTKVFAKDKCFTIAPKTLKLLTEKKYKYYPDGNLEMNCDISVYCCQSVIERIEEGDVHSTVKIPLDTSIRGIPEVKYSSGNRTHSGGSTSSVKKSKSSNLNTSMFKLFEDEKLCDVVLIVGEKTFRCHKTVLCSRSPVFLAMFENETQENQSGTIDIVDTDAETISLFLSVLYKDVLEVKDVTKIKKLYEVADKYLVTEVVQMCSGFLKEDISCSNFCGILALADSHQDKDLLDFTNEYFIQNAKTILKSKEWLKLMSVSPILTGKMMYSLSFRE